MIGGEAARDARQALAAELADLAHERPGPHHRLHCGQVVGDVLADLTRSGGSGAYIPPPIHTQPGATSK